MSALAVAALSQSNIVEGLKSLQCGPGWPGSVAEHRPRTQAIVVRFGVRAHAGVAGWIPGQERQEAANQ